MPADVILPHLTCQNVEAEIAWLTAALGFTEHYRYGAPDGAQLRLGEAWIMLNGVRPGRSSPALAGCRTQSLTVFVEDLDARYARAKAAGVEIVEELNETAYGERQFAVVDPEGHHWLFACHARDVDPAEWGAVTKE